MASDTNARLTAVAATQLGHFTARQAVAADVTHRVLSAMHRRGEVVRVHRGVYRFAAVPETWLGSVLAAVLAGGPGAVASHSTAAHLHGLTQVPLSKHPEVTVRGSRLALAEGVAFHRTRELEPLDATTVRGIPATTGARTVIDLCSRLDRSQRMTLTDDAICKRATSRNWLHRRACDLENGRTGVGTVVTITRPEAEGEFWSWLERQFARVVGLHGLPRPEYNVYNVRIFDDQGLIGIADACYQPRRVIVELLGLRFHSLPEHKQRDAERTNRYSLAGWLPLEFTWHDVVDRPDYVVDQVRRALTGRGTSAARGTRGASGL